MFCRFEKDSLMVLNICGLLGLYVVMNGNIFSSPEMVLGFRSSGCGILRALEIPLSIISFGYF